MGSYTPLLLRGVGIRVPIYPVKGISLTVPAAPWPGALKVPVIDDSGLFGLVPIGDRLRVSGSAEIARYDTTPSAQRGQAVVNNVLRSFPDFAACYDPSTARWWAGLRPVTPSGVAYMGRTGPSQPVRQCRPWASRLDDVLRRRSHCCCDCRRRGTGDRHDRLSARAGRTAALIATDGNHQCPRLSSSSPRQSCRSRTRCAPAIYVMTATLGPHFFRAENVTYDADGRVIDDGSGKGHLGIAEQTRATLENVRTALEAAGCTLADVVDMTVWLASPRDFAAFNTRVCGTFSCQQTDANSAGRRPSCSIAASR